MNLSVDAQLLEAVRAQGVSLSPVLEHALAQRWLGGNKAAIETYWEVHANGVWSDGQSRR